MGDKELNRILAELVKTNAQRSTLPSFPEVAGLSQAILSSVPVQQPYTSAKNKKADSRGPSVVNRVLDIMSRPLYASLNSLKGTLERGKDKSIAGGVFEAARSLSPITNPEMLDDLWQGISGKEKTTGRDILKTTGVDEKLPGPANAVLGFGIDVAADPLTYLGGIGLASKVGKGAKASVEALRSVEQGTGKTAQSLAEELSRKAATQATEQVEIPVAGMPAPKPGDPPRLFQAGPGPEGLKEMASREAPKLSDDLDGFRANIANLEKKLSETTDPILRQRMSKALAFDKRRLAFLEQGKTPTKTSNVAASKLELPAAPANQAAESLDAAKALSKSIQEARSPVKKNMLRQELLKLQANVRPADVLSTARTTPPEFPPVTIGPRWIETATKAAESFLANNRLQNINHIGQSRLYDKILHAAKSVRRDRRAFHVFQMLRVAEDVVKASGRHLTDAEGISVRLSDIANMSGGPRALNTRLVDDFRKARPSQQIEDLKAFTTPQMVSETLDPVIRTGKELVPYVHELPPNQTVIVGNQLSRELANIAKQAGASSREAGTARQFINELFTVARDPLYSKVQQQARRLIRQSATGIMDAQALHNISKDVYKSLGVNPSLLGKATSQTKVTEGIMTKFATWWGAKDLQPWSREYIDTARNVASAFAETIKPLVKTTTASQRTTAFAVAQGRMLAKTPEEEILSTKFRQMVERLLGTHGIDNAEAVLYRSGTTLKELNKELPANLRFIETKGTDDFGRAFDYSNGQWMHSWQEWDIKEPSEALYQLTRALQLVTRKNAMWDDAAIRWGMPIKGGEYTHEVTNVERLKGTYFPEPIANQISNLQRHFETDIFKVPHKSIELFDKVQRMWKTGVTIYSPSHHIRNLTGDIYLAALDGVVSTRPYTIASKILHAYPTRYKDLESVFNIMDPKLRDRALNARPGNIVLTTRRGDKLTAEQVYQAAESQGLFIRAMNIEDLVGDASPSSGTFGTKFQPFGGRVYDAATRVSELRDHWVRLAHFSDILTKSNAPLKIAVEQAGRRVRKFHPDGMDLTGFEQNVLRRIIPFYSWLRKATPLVVEGAIMRPHITLAFPKAMANLQLVTGIESQGPGDPFPEDQMFPEWLREKGIGPILNPGSGLGRDETWRGEAPGYTIVNPTNPFTDQVSQLGSPVKTAFSSLSPVARIPIELLTGNSSLGIPLSSSEGGVPGYLAQQIPAVGVAARLSGATRDNEPYNPEQLINWLTGMGVTGTGPYQAQARTELQQAIAEIAKKNRGDYR